MNNEQRITDNCHLSSVICRLSSVNCPLPSTSVESPLQISSFLTNKANFPDDQMNVNKVLTKDYENKSNWTLGENKPNTNPIQSQTKPISKAKSRVGAGMTESRNRQYHTLMYPIFVD